MRPPSQAKKHTADVILVGASVRSLAETAIRHRYRPHCFDMFADHDLRRILANEHLPAPQQFSDFAQLPERIQDLPAAWPVIWTGGLENAPGAFETLARQRPVCGPNSKLIQRLSHPDELRTLLQDTDVRLPRIAWQRDEVTALEPAHSWLIKPVRSAGGIGVRRWGSESGIPAGCYLEEFQSGRAASALVCCQSGRTTVLSTSAQISGDRRMGASDFWYCGNTGPVALPQKAMKGLTRVMDKLATLGFAGIAGIDFLLQEEELVLLEINPRVTAAHEIFDLTSRGSNVLDLQLGAESVESPPLDSQSNQISRLIAYVVRDSQLTPDGVRMLMKFSRSPTRPHDADMPCWLADIPCAGALTTGQPFCSIYHQWPTGCPIAQASPNRAIEMDSLVARCTGLQEIDSFAIASGVTSLF